MNKDKHTSINIEHWNENYFRKQKVIMFQFLKYNTATASMVSEATGIPQKNVCRYKRELEKSGRLFQVIKMNCQKTGFPAWFLSTNPSKSPLTNQLSLF